MRLTDKQLEIMKLLWKRKIPMSAVEIVEASDNRTWKEGSIFAIINTLIKKGAVVLAHHKPTSTINVRSYESAIILEECIISVIRDLKVSVGMCINKDELIEAIRKMEDD